MKSSTCCSEPSEPQPARTLVAIAGNPNAGKTTLFNALTGSHQKVGNYPGVTVERVTGPLRLPHSTVNCTDVPGIYSLAPVSEDEKVAVDVIYGRVDGQTPDLLVCVIDVTNLERNLYLYTQLAEIGTPIVVALTMVDRLKAAGRKLDLAKLSNLLGTQVVPVKAHTPQGLKPLLEAIESALETRQIPDFSPDLPGPVESRVAVIREHLARIGSDVSKADVRKALLDPSDPLRQKYAEIADVRELFDITALEPNPTSHGVEMRYRWAGMVQVACITEPANPQPVTLTDKIDRILTHPAFGFLIFVAVMYLVFQSIYTFAQPLMDGIDGLFAWLKEGASSRLEGNPLIQSMIVDGLLSGVGGVMLFLPQILILFFFVAVLEGTGYLSRAAFLMDRLLSWCGLNGRAFIPLLSSFACAVPGIMAARVMPDPKGRLATMLVSPLMSCSARLPVYLLLIGAFIQPQFGTAAAGFALFAMHFLGLGIAIPIVWVLNRNVLKGRRLPFMLELPPYQWPRWREVFHAMILRAKVFLRTAGTTIVLMSMVIWAASYFPHLSPADRDSLTARLKTEQPGITSQDIDKRLGEEQLATSVLGRFGKTIEPVFRPAGFDWRITTSILAAFPARETVVPSLGIIFAIGGDADAKSSDLRKAMVNATWPDGRKLFTPWTAVGLMVFFSLCAQCMATLATVKRETNSWKWPLFMFTYMTLLAYLAALLVHWISTLFGGA